MADDIKVTIQAILNDKSFKKGVDNIAKDTTKAKKGLGSLKTAFVALGGAFIATKIIAGFKKVISIASDAQETFSKFGTVFKDITKDADKVSRSLVKNFGLSSVSAKKLLSDTGDLLTGFGFTQDSALDLSKQVNELAVDLASFTNYSGGAEGASAALTKALLGEREGVKSLGISILEADVKAKVFENTQKGLTFESERQAKAFATLQIAQDQSKNAIGDFARTQNDFANQSRIAGQRLQDLIVIIGSKLLPMLTPAITMFNKLAEAILGVNNEYKGQREELIKQKQSLDVSFALLKDVTTGEENRERALRDVNTALRDAGKAELDQKSNLEDITKAQKDLNSEYIREIQILGTKEIMQEKVNKISKLVKKNIEDEIRKAKILSNQYDTSTGSIVANMKLGAQAATGRITARNKEIEGIKAEIAQIQEVTGVILDSNKKISKSNTTKNNDIVESDTITKEEQAELDSILKENLKLNEEELILFKIEQLTSFLTYFKKNDAEYKDILKARAKLEKKLDEETVKSHQESIDKKLNAIGTFAGYNQQIFGNLTALLKLYYKADGDGAEQLSAKKKKLLRAAAVAEKISAIFSIGISTAKAIINGAASPFPLNIALPIAAGILGVTQVAMVAAKPIPSFAVGTEYVKGDTMANIHRGERILRADQNITGVSNEDFYNAALAGLSAPRMAGGNVSNVSNSNENNTSDNRTFNFYGIRNLRAAANELQKTEGTRAFL